MTKQVDYRDLFHIYSRMERRFLWYRANFIRNERVAFQERENTMIKKLFFGSVILLTAISISFAGSAPNIREGLWEITVITEMGNMKMPAMTHTQCLTKNDFVPKGVQQPGQECEITDTKVDGNTVTWTIQCTTQGAEMTGTGKTTYSGDSFEGTMVMSMPQTNMEITTHMSGKRIGDCKQ